MTPLNRQLPQPAAENSHEPSIRSSASTSARIRRNLLLLVFVIMLIALWYDRKIARPNVEAAYTRIERLNTETNSRKSHVMLTSKEIHAALQTEPSHVFSQSGYQVEVYSWTAGLPFRTRDYYAVFSDVPPHRFLKHYKFELPIDEISGDFAYFTPADPSITGPQTLEMPVSDRRASGP